MNNLIFQSLFGGATVAETLIACSESQDDLGVVLRLHLVTESYLEAFISAAVNKEDMFSLEPTDNVRLRFSYSNKLSLALKLGLPLSAFKALEKFNKLRNNLAHQIQRNFIDDAILESITTHVKNIDGHTDHPIIEQSAQFFSEDGMESNTYSYRSAETPNRVKLMIIIAALIRRTTQTAIGS